MTTLSVNQHGQVTIPAKYRHMLHITPKSYVKCDIKDGTIYITPTEKKLTFEDFPLVESDIVLTDEELDAAISQAFIPSEYTNAT